MSFPSFDGFSLQDDNYITEEVNYRTIPGRELNVNDIARRPGGKVLSTDFGVRTVSISGYIIADTISDLKDKIDSLHSNITRKDSGTLQIESGRSATATVSSMSVGDPHYSQTFVPFSMELLLSDPFYYASQQSVTWDVAAGAFSLTDTIMVSGSIFAEPIITYYADAGAGYTTTSGILITYADTAEVITWSGGNPTTLADGDSVSFDYVNHKILQGTAEKDIEGVFSRWEPGSRSFTVTFSGTSDAGGTLEFAYQPRYL